MYHCTKEWAPSYEGCINPMSEGLDFPWLHETNLIISDKDRQGQAWRLYVEELVTNRANECIEVLKEKDDKRGAINHDGVTTGRVSCKDENPTVRPTCAIGIQGANKEDHTTHKYVGCAGSPDKPVGT
jgi:hypothetical protein